MYQEVKALIDKHSHTLYLFEVSGVNLRSVQRIKDKLDTCFYLLGMGTLAEAEIARRIREEHLKQDAIESLASLGGSNEI